MGPVLGPVLVWGAGAIGGTVAAYLARAGHEVTCVDVEAAHVAAIAATGLHITGPIQDFRQAMPACTPDRLEGTWRHVFLAVKAHHTHDAVRALMPHLAQDGYVLSLQNGLCEPIIAAMVGRDRTIGAFVNFSADWMAPGEIMFGGRGAVVLGELHGRTTPRLTALHETMRAFEPDAITTPAINVYLWGKLGYGAMLFAQALGQLGIADCLARADMLPVFRALGREVMEVALAEGVAPMGFNGFDPQAFMPNAAPEAAAASVAAMVAFNRPNAKTHSGIWRDIAIRRRRTEVDMQIAPVVAIGARHGLACPTMARLLVLIHEAEAGTRPLDDANLLELLDA